MTSLTSLIERIEAATEGSRELDILTGAAIDLRVDGGHLSFRNSFEICGMEQMLRMAESYQNIWREALPRYSTSIDAALTLLPEGYAVTGLMIWPGERSSVSVIETRYRPFGKDRRMSWVREAGCRQWPGDGATPCLALLAAILRARQTEATNGANPELLPTFDDADVQIAYRILCQIDENTPPGDEHWEGFTARRIIAALRRLASSDGGVKVRELEWTVEKRYGYDVHVGRGTGLMYEAAIKACSPGWVVTYGGETIFNSDEANEDAAKAAAQSDYETRIRSALVAAPPADAGMREAVQQAIDEAAHLASIHAHHALWSGLLPYGWDSATEQFGRNLAGAIAEAIKVDLPKRLPALTAPGATTKSDGGAKAGSSPILASKEDQRTRAHGVMPVGDNADASGCTGTGPSDPSSTRSEVTVETLKYAEKAFDQIRLTLIKHLDEPARSAFWQAVEGREVCKAALLETHQIRKKS